MKHVIVGGVAGGATAAARLRRLDETAEIILIERGEHISYANCGLPYYLGGVIAERDRLLVQTPEAFGRRYGVDVRVRHEVVGLDPAAHTLSVRTADGRTYSETYDRLLLSPGAEPVRPPLEGIDTEGVFTLRNVADTDRIKAHLASHDVRSAVVVGGGFIGLEMAENLVHAGAAVTLVEMGNQVMAPLDYSMAAPVARHLVAKGVSLRLEEAVTAFRPGDGRIDVVLRSGDVVRADLVLLSIGVRPAVGLAREAGLRIGEAGGIWVDATLATSAPDVYAVGDAIEFPHPLTGRPWLNYLAGPANRQARIAADNMALGRGERYEGSLGTSIAKVFDLTVASVGLPAKRLAREGIAFRSSVTHSSSHAGYYPGALPLTIKLTYAPDTGRLLGAQVVGCDGVDKRVDELAQLMKHGATVRDLMATEHAYAPPFSSAKDPVAIAGYVGGRTDNIMMRISEMILSFPSLILAMIINAVMGSNLFNTMFALVIVAWPTYARLMRSVVLSVKENEYVTASKALGASKLRILIKEVIPNSISSVLIMATTDIGNQILMFSTLSFLGLGSAPPTPEWGMMVSEGVNYFNKFWVAGFPGLAIFTMAVGANFIGDGLRDLLDPKLRKEF